MIKTYAFTERFIERLAEDLHAIYQNSGDLSQVLLVFGGQRPELFLKKALAKLIKGPFLPPQYLSIDQFMNRIYPSGRRLGDLDHAYLIYQITKEHCPQVMRGRETFVQFLPWAREIIHFIEQLDLEAVESSALADIKKQAAIGFEVPEDINRLLESLFLIRLKYHHHLEETGFTTRGFTYLKAMRQIDKVQLLKEFQAIYFCNFFYVHRTEMVVIKHAVNQGVGHVILQGDERKWPALARIGDQFKVQVTEGKEIAPKKFSLKLYAAKDMHAQAAWVKEIINSIHDLANTVIVLPNPDFLIVLLSAIQLHQEPYNISLGYPIRRTSFYNLVETIVAAHKAFKDGHYNSRCYIKALRHPLVLAWPVGLAPEAFKVLVQHIDNALRGSIASALAGKLYIQIEDIINDPYIFDSSVDALRGLGYEVTTEQLKAEMVRVHALLFGAWENVNNFAGLAQVVGQLCEAFASFDLVVHYPLNAKVLVRIREIAQEWGQSSTANETFELFVLLRLAEERFMREIIAFVGSPLKGLQVLGLQETRSLSFDHVIVVDANESILPSLNIYEPLIPREVMVRLNIDRLELEEQIQRYQFMRLISAAKSVHLLYLDRPDKQRSRFIEELVWEEERHQSKVGALPIMQKSFPVSVMPQVRQVVKTPRMIETLLTMTYSASSINTYVQNPYEFYLSYVLGLKEKDDMLDDPQGKHIGMLVHDVMEQAFKNIARQKINLDESFKKKFMMIVESKFNEYFPSGRLSDTFLTKMVLLHRLERFINEESERFNSQVEQILYVEKKFTDTFHLAGHDVKFSFRFDRVDRMRDQSVLLIDYKTAADVPMPRLRQGIESLASREEVFNEIGSFQMPLYMHYLQRQFPHERVNAALYHLRTMRLDYFAIPSEIQAANVDLSAYLNALELIMREIFNPNIPFVDVNSVIE